MENEDKFKYAMKCLNEPIKFILVMQPIMDTFIPRYLNEIVLLNAGSIYVIILGTTYFTLNSI